MYGIHTNTPPPHPLGEWALHSTKDYALVHCIVQNLRISKAIVRVLLKKYGHIR